MARRGRKHRRSKASGWKKMKGLIYTGSVAGPGMIAFNQLGGMSDPVNAAAKTVMAYGGMNASGKFDMAVLAQMWAPVATVAIVDLVSSKLTIQRRISTGLRGFLR